MSHHKSTNYFVVAPLLKMNVAQYFILGRGRGEARVGLGTQGMYLYLEVGLTVSQKNLAN